MRDVATGRGHCPTGSRIQQVRGCMGVIGEVGVARLLLMLASCNDYLVASGVLLWSPRREYIAGSVPVCMTDVLTRLMTIVIG